MQHMIRFRMALGLILVSLFLFPKSLICHQCLSSSPYIFDFIETTKNLHLFFFLQNTIIQSTLQGVCCCMNVVCCIVQDQFLQFLTKKRCLFTNFFDFDSFFTNFSYFLPFAVILRASDTNFPLSLRFRSNLCVHAQNDGK